MSVSRGDSFRHTVKFGVQAPAKINAEFDRDTIKPGESPDVNLKIKGAEDAPEGDHTITITGTPDSGQPTCTNLTVKAAKR